ncbi:MAG: hypothetical protein OXQ94_09555, partial [Gemmatimonadota bacterium]|nr:hypothetical protein [Gemmatimonadota bacterium]
VWPHSVSPLRRLAGGCAPSDPGVSGPPLEQRAARCSNPRNPVAVAAAERCPVVADGPADVILDGPPTGSLVATGEGLRIIRP